MFAVSDRAFDDLISRVNASSDLDQNLYLRVVGELERVVGDFELREVNVARFIAVAHGDGAYLELGVAGEQRYDAGAYRSQAKNAKNRFCGHNQRSLTGRPTWINRFCGEWGGMGSGGRVGMCGMANERYYPPPTHSPTPHSPLPTPNLTPAAGGRLL